MLDLSLLEWFRNVNSLISFVQDFFPDILEKGDYFVERSFNFSLKVFFVCFFIRNTFIRGLEKDLK